MRGSLFHLHDAHTQAYTIINTTSSPICEMPHAACSKKKIETRWVTDLSEARFFHPQTQWCFYLNLNYDTTKIATYMYKTWTNCCWGWFFSIKNDIHHAEFVWQRIQCLRILCSCVRLENIRRARYGIFLYLMSLGEIILMGWHTVANEWSQGIMQHVTRVFARIK